MSSAEAREVGIAAPPTSEAPRFRLGGASLASEWRVCGSGAGSCIPLPAGSAPDRTKMGLCGLFATHSRASRYVDGSGGRLSTLIVRSCTLSVRATRLAGGSGRPKSSMRVVAD